MKGLMAKIPQGRVRYKAGDLVRITKEKVKFAKGYEHNFSTETSRVVKVNQRVIQPLYELRFGSSSYGKPVLQLQTCLGHCIPKQKRY